LFFDLDNTLWDFNGNAFESLKEVFIFHKLEKYFDDFEHFWKLYKYRNEQLWELYPQGLITRKQLNLERFLYPLSQVGNHNEDLAIEISDDYLEICPSKTTLMPYAEEILEYLKPNYKIHLITNGFSKVQYTKIKSSGLEKYINNTFLSEAVGYHKPDRRIFEHAVKSSNAKKNESLMIGDNFRADIAGAKNFGIDQSYYSSEPDQTLPFLPTYQISSLIELKDIL
jgi:putative hydrolase of the HAD superfamily